MTSHTGNKEKRILLVAFALFLLLPAVNAALDPLEYYSEHPSMEGDRGMYRIDTFWLGTDIVDIELIDNTDVCFRNCEATLRIHPYRDIETNSEEYALEFEDVFGKITGLKDYSYEILASDTYETVKEECISYQNHTYFNETNGSNTSYTVTSCSEFENITYNEEITEFTEFDITNFTFPANSDYYIKIKGIKERPINIDWIPTFLGYKLDAWAWWNSSWENKKPINISSNTAVNNYQIAINITYDSDMQNDFDDLIFVNEEENTELDYWIQDKSDGTWCYVWVEIDSIDTDNGTQAYMYYGSDSTSSNSDIKETFIFADDFDDASIDSSLWTTQADTPSESGGYLLIDNDDEIWGDTAFAPGNISATAYVNTSEQDNTLLQLWNSQCTDTSEYGFTIYTSDYHFNGEFSKTRYRTGLNSSYFESSDITDIDVRQFLPYEIKIYSNRTEYYKNNSLKATHTTTTNFPTNDIFVRLESWDSSVESSNYFDYVFVRKLLETEPTIILGTEESAAAISLTRNAQTPADVTSGNIFDENLYIQYNITAGGTAVLDETLLYFKTNTTTSDINYYINGTATVGWQESEACCNTSDLYNFTLQDNEIYPATYNIDPDYFRSVQNSNFTFTGNTDYYKIKFFNVSNETQYNEFEIMAIRTGELPIGSQPQPMPVYYCNSSYTSGKPTTDDNCQLVIDISGWTTSYDHCHGTNNYSCHIVEPLAINTTDGTLNGIKVTPESYFLLERPGNSEWTISYISNITRSDQVQSSISNGNTWSNFAGTINAHLHQFTGEENLSYYAWANDTNGNNYTSTTYTESIELDPLAPGAVVIYDPALNSSYEDNLIINYSASISPQNDTIEYYNITLYNESLDLEQIIQGNNSNNLTYNWSLSSIDAGTYRIGVEAFDNNSLSTIIYSENFFVVKYAPTISIDWNASNINISEANHTISFTVVDNVSNSFNCSLNLNGDISYQNTTNNTATSANISLVPGLNYANISCTDQGGSTGSEYSTYTLNNFIDTLCTFGNVLFNFTFVDIEDESALNADIENTFYIYNSTGDNVYNYSEEDTNVSYYALCILNYTSDYTVSSFQQYSSEGYEAKNYSQRTYYLNNASMTALNNITLYLLDEEEVTQILFHTTDNVGTPLEDLYIKVQEYNVGTGSAETVNILKTDSNGEALANLNLYETWYIFIIENEDGEVLKTTAPQQLNTNEYYFRINPSVTVLETYLDITGLAYSLTYSNVTNRTIFTLTDTTGLANNICLKVVEQSFGGQDVLTDTCVTTSSATLTYNFSASEDELYIATGYVLISGDYGEVPIIIDDLEINRGTAVSIYGLTGVILAIFLLGTIMFAGLFNPVAPIILGIVGLGLLSLMGILTVPITALASLFVVGAVLLYFLRR